MNFIKGRANRAPISICLAFLVFFVAAYPAFAEGVNDGKKREYVIRQVDQGAKDDNADRKFFNVNEFTTWVEETTYEGQKAYTFKRVDKTLEGDVLDWTVIISASDNSIYKVERTITTREGKRLESRQEYYSNHFHKYAGKSFPPVMLPFVMQYLDLTEGASHECSFVFSPEWDGWPMYLHVEGRETITVPAGTFDCIKVRIEYKKDNLPGIFKYIPSFMAKRLISDLYMWVDADSPHAMVKLQGKIEGFASPEKVQELTKVY